jgi:hypothetical protein
LDWSTTADVILKLAQTIALVVAGWWTYSLFVKQRHDRRRANLTHRLMELAIEGERTVVRVEVVVQNIGNVVLAPPKGTVKLYQVRPLPPEVLDALSTVDTTDTTRGDPAACELPWKRIAKMSFLIGEDNMVLEPGESDFLACDFVIPALVTSIFVRTELLCGDEDAPDQHWHHETLHELKLRSTDPAA